MTEQLRAAVIGAGRMGMVHGHLLQLHPHTQLVGLVDSDKSLASQLASQGLKAPLFDSVEAVTTQARPDLFFVCTPTHTHLPIVRACLQHRKHLFVEKPLAASLGDAEAILAAADQAGVIHGAGYVYVHLPIVAAAQALLSGDVLGPLIRFTSHAYISEVFGPKQGWFFQPEQSGGGVVANMTSHLLAILSRFFGPASSVTASVRSHHTAADDSAQALITFTSGITGLVDSSWSMPGTQMLDFGMTVDGKNGTLVLERERIQLHLLTARAGRPAGWSTIHAADVPADTAFDISPHIGGEAFYRQLSAFVAACRDGSQPFFSLTEAARIQRLIDGIYRSASSGAAVSIQ